MSGELEILEVTTPKDLKRFISFPELLYADHPYFIVPMRKKELHTLSAERNPAFAFCKARYWLVLRKGNVVGRVAGIINTRYNEERSLKSARIGWLDFVNDEEVLRLLLDTVESWAKSENMEFIHGPLGFSSFDPSGILLEGFDELPTSFARYNYAYYPEMLERNGYRKEMDWIEYLVTVPRQVPEEMERGAAIVERRYGLKTVPIQSGKDLEKYADAIFGLLNEEYKELYAFSQLTEQQISALKADFLPMIKPGFVSIVIDQENQLVAFGITMPSLARALQKAKGKLFPFGIWHIWKAMNRNNLADTLLIAVKGSYHGKGVHALIFREIIPTLVKHGITHIESTRNMEENSKVTNLWGRFEHRQHKRTRSYIKEL